ncbi:MAG TPA: DUF3426 domain-containing protein, partial [Roseateles sp.]|nr:DUF3426 domain-containing protein [Roseateles sp.]
PEPEPESEPDPPPPDRPIRARVEDHSDAADFPVSTLPDSSSRREPYWSGSAEPVAEPLAALPDLRADDVTLAPSLAALQDRSAATGPVEQDLPPSNAATTDAPQASFLRQGRPARTRWNGPGMRMALALAAALLLVALLLQLTLQYRNALLAIQPQSRPLLQSFCNLAGCTLEPWKRIDALEVESSGLTQAGSGNHYKLSVMLRNKAAYPVALPWVDLSLTDASGAQVARRMLKPAELAAGRSAIAGHGEEPLQLVFSTGAQKVSGYHVVIFHP